VSGSSLFCPTCGAANGAQETVCFACGQSLHAPAVETQRILKQRYRIVGLLGQGGMGAVYRAEDSELGDRPVAVKEMSPRGLSQVEEAEATQAFKREALLLAGLMHANLPRIYDHFAEEERWYLVMDLVEGETLEDYLARQPDGKLPLQEVLTLGSQLCTVLEYLHTRQPPIIFRDLKPSNIMRTGDGHLYLIDFGIARHFKPGQLKDTVAFGSPGYAAPEQYGKTQTTPRADIYSLGALLHQMLSGEDPSVTPFFFSSLAGNSEAAALWPLLSQMLEMDAQKRPASIAPVKQALEHMERQGQIRQFSPLLEPAPSSPLTAVRLDTYADHSDWISAVAWSPDGTFIASASYDKTVSVRDVTTGTLTRVYYEHARRWRPGRVHTLSWSPDGAYIASAGDDRVVRIWEVTSGETVFTYHEHTERLLALAWSPSGEYIASAGDYIIRVWDAVTGEAVSVYSGHSNVVQSLAWSPDGQYLASAGRDATARILSDGTGVKAATWCHTVYSGHKSIIQALSWSPDSARVVTASADCTAQVWEALSGRHLLTYHGHARALKAVAWSPDGRYIATAGADETVQIWDARNGDHVLTYHKHTDTVFTIAWSPDSSRIASGGADNHVQVWALT